MEEAKKADSGKPQLDLLPREGIEQIARVLEYGNRKYGVGNYKKGRAWRRDAGAILRHVFAWLDGEDLDPESGLSHLAHAGCGVMFLLEYLKTHPELDNRAGEFKPYREETEGVEEPPMPLLLSGYVGRRLTEHEKLHDRRAGDYFLSAGTTWRQTNVDGKPALDCPYFRMEKA